MSRVSIHITSKDRATEVALLLQSLRTQTYQDWDIVLLDDCSGTPLLNFGFIQTILNRIKLENHRVKILRNDFSKGVCAARQRLIDEDDFNNEYTCRLDDDCVPQPDYLRKLLSGFDIRQPYDMMTGVIPLMAYPETIRETRFVEPVICKHEFDNEGNLSMKDELWATYDEKIILCHQFRTNCLYRSKINKEVRYPQNLSKIGFREEAFFSLKAQSLGYKLGCNTGAVAYHLQTASGGCRTPDYAELVKLDDETFKEWAKKLYKEKGDFLCKR